MDEIKENENELLDMVLTLRRLLCYLALEYKGEKMMLNAEGLAALMHFRDFYNIETIDKYLVDTNKILEEKYGKV